MCMIYAWRQVISHHLYFSERFFSLFMNQALPVPFILLTMIISVRLPENTYSLKHPSGCLTLYSSGDFIFTNHQQSAANPLLTIRRSFRKKMKCFFPADNMGLLFKETRDLSQEKWSNNMGKTAFFLKFLLFNRNIILLSKKV